MSDLHQCEVETKIVVEPVKMEDFETLLQKFGEVHDPEQPDQKSGIETDFDELFDVCNKARIALIVESIELEALSKVHGEDFNTRTQAMLQEKVPAFMKARQCLRDMIAEYPQLEEYDKKKIQEARDIQDELGLPGGNEKKEEAAESAEAEVE